MQLVTCTCKHSKVTQQSFENSISQWSDQRQQTPLFKLRVDKYCCRLSLWIYHSQDVNTGPEAHFIYLLFFWSYTYNNILKILINHFDSVKIFLLAVFCSNVWVVLENWNRKFHFFWTSKLSTSSELVYGV